MIFFFILPFVVVVFMEKVEFIIVDKIVETLCVDANWVIVTNIELAVIGNVDGVVLIAVGFTEVVLGFME